MTSLETARLAAKALDSKKGLDIKIIKIQDISSIADYFVIATGTSNTHVKALADEAEYQLSEAGLSASGIEGQRNDTWILLDYIDVVIHVFSEDARDYYSLERLWEDGTSVTLAPEL